MVWEKPVVTEVKMDAEIGSYQPDEELPIPAEASDDDSE
jgi:hypothetical protein